MAEPWTVRSIVAWMASDFAARGIESARLDAELLVAHALGLSRVGVYMDLDRPLTPTELETIRALVVRRRAREPVAYVMGTKEHYGRAFVVTKDVLVPRPDTELLIALALDRLPPAAEGAWPRVLDLCTGSGVVAVALAKEREDVRVDATDVSAAALAVARQNVAKHGVESRVALHEGDLWSALPDGETWDVITANPPYVAESERARLAPELAHEPEVALFAAEDGLAVVRRILEGSRARLAPGGSVLVELGHGQAARATALARAAGLADVAAHEDLGKIERVVSGRRA